MVSTNTDDMITDHMYCIMGYQRLASPPCVEARGYGTLLYRNTPIEKSQNYSRRNGITIEGIQFCCRYGTSSISIEGRKVKQKRNKCERKRPFTFAEDSASFFNVF
jgi:hypothetical protein